jgi:hypothetical protein
MDRIRVEEVGSRYNDYMNGYTGIALLFFLLD